MRMRTDLVFSVGSGVGSAAIGLLVVPIYVRLLGIEAYGLVGFLALLQGLLAVLDLGLMPTAVRSVAHHRALDDPEPARALIATLAVWYALIGLLIGLTVVAASGWIATRWLDPRHLPLTTVTTSVALMGLILALRWPAGIYGGALIGCHQLTLVSLLNLGITVAGAVGGVVLLMTVAPRVELLFFWQAALATVSLLVQRSLTRGFLGVSTSRWQPLAPLRPVWRFSLDMAGIIVVAMLLTQLDKAVLSNFLSLEAFGAYSLAAVLGRALYLAINPLNNLVQPRFTALAAMGNTAELSHVYRQWSTIFAGVFVPASMALVLGAAPLLRLWLGDAVLATRISPWVALIAIGAGFHSVMTFPFALQVATGDSRTPLVTNLILLTLYVPTLLLLVVHLGALGAAVASMLLFGTYLLLGTWLAHRRVLPGIARPWLCVDIGVPLAITIAVGGLGMWTLRFAPDWPVLRLAIAAAAAGLACMACQSVALWRFPGLLNAIIGRSWAARL